MPRKSPLQIQQMRVNDLIGTRKAAIDAMNGPLRKKFNLIERSVNDLRAENLRYYYRIGALCVEISDNPSVYIGKGNESGLALIEQALSTQARTLRSAALFARKCTPTELEDLISLYHEDTNFQLHWGHVAFLLSLDTPEERTKFAETAVEEMLDPDALHQRIRKDTGRTDGHGRTHAMPATPAKQIRQIMTIAKQFMGKHTTVWNGPDQSVFNNLLNLKGEDITEQMIDDLTDAEEFMLQIVDAAESNAEMIERCREYMAAAMTAYDNEMGEEEDTGESAIELKSKAREKETRAIDLGTKSKSRKTGKKKRQTATT